jgi:hypothetical protein
MTTLIIVLFSGTVKEFFMGTLKRVIRCLINRAGFTLPGC